MNTIMPTAKKPLGAFISKKRTEAGLTPSELSERSGLSPAYISRVENGDYASPSLTTIKALAEGLGLSVRVFLEEAGLLNNEERPSYKLISQSLRHMGYSDTQAEDVIRYARYVKEKRNQ